LRTSPSSILVLSHNHRAYADSASRSLGRIYRSHYPQREYEKLGLEANRLWKSGDLKEYFHETAKVTMQPDGSEDIETGAARLDAHRILLKAGEEAKRRGVKIVTDTVVHLLWDGSRCIGAATRVGAAFHADTVLLALGAALQSFLAREKLPIDDICEFIVVPWMHTQLSEQQYEELKEKSILVIAYCW
jgi:hypothetical protein